MTGRTCQTVKLSQFIARCHFSIKLQQFSHHAHESRLFSRNVQSLITAGVPTQQTTATYCHTRDLQRQRHFGINKTNGRQVACDSLYRKQPKEISLRPLIFLHRTAQPTIFTNKYAQCHYKLLHGSVPEAVQARSYSHLVSTDI